MNSFSSVLISIYFPDWVFNIPMDNYPRYCDIEIKKIHEYFLNTSYTHFLCIDIREYNANNWLDL